VGAARPEGGVPQDRGLSAERRVRRGPEIRDLFRRGKRRRTSHLDVFLGASPVSHPRLGLVVPKHRQTVVKRNRLRRRLREIGRIEVLPRLREGGPHGAPLALDILVRARKEAYEASFEELKEELVGLTEGLCSDR
jgi:ribonuclease P protein component